MNSNDQAYAKAFLELRKRATIYKISTILLFLLILLAFFFNIKIEDYWLITILSSTLFLALLSSVFRYERLSEEYRYKEITKNELQALYENHTKITTTSRLVSDEQFYKNVFNELSTQLKTNPNKVAFREGNYGTLYKLLKFISNKKRLTNEK